MRTTHHVRHCSLAATPPPVGAWPIPNGGNGVIRGTTRRRHAASHLLMLQNPHRRRCGRYCEADEIGGDYLAWPRRGVAGDERLVTGDMDGAERTQDSPNKNRAGPLRYKTRPADPFSPDLRYKTLPARSKSPYLARFARAGRTLYRCHQQEAVRGELCTACEAETALAITAHHGPRAWRARRTWLRCLWAVAGPGRASRRRAEPPIRDQAPLVWRAPEGPEGTGGLRDRPLRAKLACGDLAGGRARRRPEHPWGYKRHHAARTARGRAAADGHTEQPGPAAGTSGARNTRGATKQPGRTQQRARSAAAPRAPRVCQLLTG